MAGACPGTSGWLAAPAMVGSFDVQQLGARRDQLPCKRGISASSGAALLCLQILLIGGPGISLCLMLALVYSVCEWGC